MSLIRLDFNEFNHRPSNIMSIAETLVPSTLIRVDKERLGFNTIIGVRETGPNGQIPAKHRSWRISTHFSPIKMLYFEEWRLNNTDRVFDLMQISLQLYLADYSTNNEKELLALHSEPGVEINNENRAFHDYKVLPHIHASLAEYPFDKIHIPLEISAAEEVMQSCSSLDQSFLKIAKMLHIELGRFRDEWT